MKSPNWMWEIVESHGDFDDDHVVIASGEGCDTETEALGVGMSEILRRTTSKQIVRGWYLNTWIQSEKVFILNTANPRSETNGEQEKQIVG